MLWATKSVEARRRRVCAGWSSSASCSSADSEYVREGAVEGAMEGARGSSGMQIAVESAMIDAVVLGGFLEKMGFTVR